MDYHALANDVVDETLKCELCCCILLRMGSRFTSSPQGRESSIKKGADFAFAFYGYRVYPLDEAYLFALRGAILCVASQKGAGPFSASAVHLEPYRYWRACSRIRTNAILRACKAVPKDEENSACVQIGNTGRLAYRHLRCFKTSPHKHTAMGMAQRLKPRRRSAHICTQHRQTVRIGFINL